MADRLQKVTIIYEQLLSEIFRELEGPCYLVMCIARPSTCTRTQECAARQVWQMLGDRMEEILSGITLADLAERQKQIGEQEAAMYYI